MSPYDDSSFLRGLSLHQHLTDLSEVFTNLSAEPPRVVLWGARRGDIQLGSPEDKLWVRRLNLRWRMFSPLANMKAMLAIYERERGYNPWHGTRYLDSLSRREP